jgi:hypothetical protein
VTTEGIVSMSQITRVTSSVALALAASGWANRPVPRMFPAFTMFRGGGLLHDVLLGHSNVTTISINGRSAANLDHDPLAIIYQTLVSTNRVPPDVPDIVTAYDVAEFFGPEWMALSGPDGKPTRELRFEEANHFSHLYVMRTGPPIWMDPVVAPGGGSYSLLIVSDTAQAILTRLGLRFH